MPKLSKFKVVLVGDQNVGKTSIISRFIHDSFELTSNPTVGIDFVTKTMQVDGETMRLQLWDTAGQQRFRSLIPSYVRDADCCLVVLDISSKVSFDGIDKWIDFVRQTRGSDGLLVMIGNKIDLQRQISKEQIESFAQKNNIMYQEVSARNATNISLLFRKIAEKLIQGKRGLSTEETETKKTGTAQNGEDKKNIVLNAEQQKKDQTKNCAC